MKFDVKNSNFNEVDRTEKSIYYKHNNLNVLLVEHLTDVTLDIDDCKIILDKVKSNVKRGIPIYGILIFHKGATMTEEGQAFFAKDPFSQNETTAMGVIYQQLFQRFLVAAYIKFKKPKVATKTFKSVEKALVWIKELEGKKKTNAIKNETFIV